jgi:hypothetical protein
MPPLALFSNGNSFNRPGERRIHEDYLSRLAGPCQDRGNI